MDLTSHFGSKNPWHCRFTWIILSLNKHRTCLDIRSPVDMDSRIHPLVFDNYRLYISTLLFCCGVTSVCLPIHKIIDMRILTQFVKFIGFQSEISLMGPTEEFTGLNDKTQLGMYSGYLAEKRPRKSEWSWFPFHGIHAGSKGHEKEED